MKIEQIYTGCIAHAAYYLESQGEVAIFDPLRDVQAYIDRADAAGAKIKYVFETHFHADFVSGHLDLVKKTGASVVFGPTANPNYDAIIATDNQVFDVGGVRVKVLHTPGHTMESTTYLIYDEQGLEHALITGDTLFIGDVGRPDLVQLVKSEITEEILARHLFHSLRTKIMPLSDHLIVYPNHGAGSACGKNMSKETSDTLGNQKMTNYALRADMTEDEFVSELLSGLAKPPQYFPNNVLMNIQGYDHLENVLDRANRPIELEDFKALLNDDSILVLDTRDPQTFSEGFIPKSINIGLKGPFAVWVGEMISDIKQKIVLITDEGKEEESMIRLSRVGYDQTIGYLEGGFDTWKKASLPVDVIERIDVNEMEGVIIERNAILFDVRKINEYNAEHLENSINLSLNQLVDRINEVSDDNLLIIYCAGGYRSMIAASVLYKYGIRNLVDVKGGFNAIRDNSALPKTKYVCPSSLL
ncbi:MBL fold metallo-hydrolase [Myroides pelagicus]|uniref:MBL fold metallo-hydrolase n=1 Tax=Myroides pelagicus TaxID=270914 RepID=A0A7K1GJD1_9FLAO|nr:rhodanese-like domain-containing protein [Myroides pelagicus]MEC4113000.1 rhodanese-like domain-containing protein [Myroides pelagicus]MTH28997.1 MBL fold metallo-hydrolase [Myroides pelagicus]